MLIADDHVIVRQRLKLLLQEAFLVIHITEVGDTTSLLHEAETNDWDIIISDLAMPGGGGLLALQKLKQLKPYIPVLIVSTYPEEQYAKRVSAAGAAAFLNKNNADRELVVLVQQILGETSPK